MYHIHCNIEIDVDKIIHRFAKVSSAREEWNWPISCLNDSETRKGEFRKLKLKKKTVSTKFVFVPHSFDF